MTGIYTRISEDRDGAGLGVARQRQDCERLAADRGWRVARVYEENDTSAYGGKPRKHYQRMLADLSAGVINAVICWDLDRLTHRPIEIEQFIDLADRHGVALASVGGDCDLATDNGRLFARIKGAVARAEVDAKSRRQKRANLQRAQNGAPRPSKRPYGYRTDGIEIDRAEAGELRAAYDALLAGATLGELVADLNERGIRTSQGATWSPTTLRRVLMRPRNAGLSEYKGEVVGPAQWQPVVPEETWRAACAQLSDPSRRTATTNVRKYLLSGLAVCGICEARMFASPMQGRGGRTWMTYRCRTAHLMRRLDLIDDVVERTVVARLSQPDAADLLDPPGTGGVDTDELRQEANGLRARLETLAVDFADGALTAAQLRAATDRLRANLANVDAQLSEAGRENVLAPLVGAPDVAAGWRSLSLGRKRAVIDALMTVAVLPAGKGVRFTSDQVQITWRQT